MKKIANLQVFILFSYNIFAQTATWQNPLPQGNKLNDVFFIDTNVGWAVGDGGVIIKTTNGGTTWTVNYHSTCIGLNKVFFVSNLIGWAVGVYGTIIKTTDGGQNWVAQNSGIQYTLLGVYFTNTSDGIAVGDLGVTLRTSNGGSTWMLGGSVSLNPVLNDLFSDNLGNSWVVGTAGRIAKSTDGGSTWEDMVSGTNTTLRAVQFKTSLIGWAVGNLGVILKSIDGGATWTTSNVGISNAYNFVDIAFLDQNNGFAIDSKGFVFKTTNGGANWNIVLNGNLSSTITILGAASLQNINNIIVVGNKGNIQKTTDSGVSWVSISSGVSNNNTSSSIFFTDVNNGWVVSRGSTNEKVLKTTNGGNTWSAKLSNANLQLNKVFFINSTTGWVVGDNGVSAEGKVFKTTDAGETWTEQTLLGSTVVTLRDVHFVNTTTGLAVGAGGKIFLTTDGGTTWNSQSSGITDNFLSVFFLDINTAWCTTANGKILKTVNGGITWLQQTSGFTLSIRDVFFLNNNDGYALADYTNVLKTTDGGTTWSSQNLGLSSIGGTITLLKIKFFDTNNGIVLGYDSQRGVFFTTNNGGTTWTPNYLPIAGGSPSNSFIKNYFVLNQNSLFTVGNFSSILKYATSTCPNTLSPTGTITNNQKAAMSVSTTGTNTIPNAANVTYQAGNFVQLNAGFSVVSGSVFTAKILVGCN
jgi:photosystem II stability/assembly factor-like uncharacterized protein